MSALSFTPDPDVAMWNALPGWLLLLTPEGRALYANAALSAWSGCSHEALLGAGWRAALAPASADALLAQLARGADFQLELGLLDREGGETPVHCAARWCPGDGHQPTCICLLHPPAPNRRESTLSRRSPQTQAALFRLLADNVPVLIAYYSAADFRCRFANQAYARSFGRDEESIVGLGLEEIVGSEATREIRPHVQRMFAEHVPVQYERMLRTEQGGTRWLEVHLLPHLGDVLGRAETAVIGAFVLITDITRHHEAEQAVRESEERLDKFMQASAEGIVFHRDAVISDANPAMCKLVGCPLDQLLGRKTLEFIAPEHMAKVVAVYTANEETTYESVLIDTQGRRIAVELIVRTLLRHGERLRMTIVRDIRDRHSAQARIHHLAHHDPLTGLPNRMSFMEHVQRSIVGAEATGAMLALLFIDLDHFKRVNDSLGHLVGDTLLCTVAARITASLRATDIVGRFGGDEFMVLLSSLPDSAAHGARIEEVAQKLITSIGAPVYAEGRPLSVTPSVGIALYPADGTTPEALVRHADSAMYLAKARGRANYQFCVHGIADAAYADLVMEGQLAQALERGEFVLHFQPQVAARDGRVIGAEALIRWQHPERGLLLPEAFIALAEKRQLMVPIGQWVLTEAARCAVHWQQLGLGVAPVAINLSNVQFHAAAFIEAVAQVLPPDGLGRGLLELELTERMLMDDVDQMKQRLLRLKAMGLQISVDDFGTGYSSLGHLKALPIDKLKIDRSFVHDLPADRDSVAITRAIIQMGRSLDMTVVAEGVETEAQRGFLAENGCDELQGLLVSEPLPQQAFEDWVRQRRAG